MGIAWSESEEEAVDQLNLLTPRRFDVLDCNTLHGAWERLDSYYLEPKKISSGLIREFVCFDLTKDNNESNLVQLRNRLLKLQTDL